MVLDTAKDKVWVKMTACDNCTTCNSGGGCRSRLFTMFNGDKKLFELDTPSHSYKPGDILNLSCPPQLPLLIITTMYFVPMLIFVILSVVGHYALALPELGTLLLASASLLYYLAIYLARPAFIWQRLLSFKINKI